ncbi:MAG: aldo/keto reductase [Spirochaetia bacterium]|jgi:aryl-alcohol dehydrogenase-like predicted oxidoreductase
MRKRKLGSQGPEITVIGVGTWAIGGGGWQYSWGKQDDRDSIAAIHRAIELGISWIDTAAIYGLGHSEEVVGRAVAGRRSKVMIATKCSRTWDAGRTAIQDNLSASSVRAELEASLRRLGTDYIDLYQVHWPRPEEQVEEGWAEIAKAVKEGKVRFAGVSNFSVGQIRRIHAIHPVTSLQPPYSMLRREAEKELLPFCRQNGIGVVVYSPMQMGLLSGAFSRDRMARLDADDMRSKSPFFTEPALSRNLALVDKLKPIARQAGRSMAELAIAWVLRRPEVTAAIVGARRPEQVGETVSAADWDLTESEKAEIDALLSAREAMG